MSVASKSVAIVASAGVLAIGWQIGAARQQQLEAPASPMPTAGQSPTAVAIPSPTSPAASTEPTTIPSMPSTIAPPPPVTMPTSEPPPPITETLTGDTVTHKYGTVTVTVTLTDGVIADISANSTSVDSKSTTLTQAALPVLHSRVLAADSAAVDTVSGATFTSRAYLSSLQSALDKA